MKDAAGGENLGQNDQGKRRIETVDDVVSGGRSGMKKEGNAVYALAEQKERVEDQKDRRGFPEIARVAPEVIVRKEQVARGQEEQKEESGHRLEVVARGEPMIWRRVPSL